MSTTSLRGGKDCLEVEAVENFFLHLYTHSIIGPSMRSLYAKYHPSTRSRTLQKNFGGWVVVAGGYHSEYSVLLWAKIWAED